MSELLTFSKDGFGEIRTVDMNGKIYFVATDIARVLGYKNTSDAVARHCKGVVKHDTLTNGGKQEINIIPEGDLYRLITHSKLPEAEKFESWVFDEVLPDIRKHGLYATTPTIDSILNDPDFGIKLLTEYKKEKQKAEQLEHKNEVLQQQLDESKNWFTIKRVAQINGVEWQGLDWRKLKHQSIVMDRQIHKIFDANFGEVNLYHLAVFRAVYPELRYN